jgi:ubiquitin carboxyl-terminal hydrolase 26/29/37
LGISPSSGHYISDVFNLKDNFWLSYDDDKVEKLTESEVLKNRANTGYIFFYIHKQLLYD